METGSKSPDIRLIHMIRIRKSSYPRLQISNQAAVGRTLYFVVGPDEKVISNIKYFTGGRRER